MKSWGPGDSAYACPGGGTPALRIKTRRLQDHCREYLNGRRATYEMRRTRFEAVARVMKNAFGLTDADTVFDLGAGHCQFDYFLRVECEWRGVYVPIDGHIDGTDLQTWAPPKKQPDIYVLTEILEHLPWPLELLARLKPRKGIVLTTPNVEVVDVLACDPDHHSVVRACDLRRRRFEVRAHGFFGHDRDTLLAWRRA